ncbi:MAG: DUF2194 domain-containing protein [Candidatus Riflebacteria bacterium]|nr:DUF2194 domain-containing protein [Candidatus Riflebacteria bacterium]
MILITAFIKLHRALLIFFIFSFLAGSLLALPFSSGFQRNLKTSRGEESKKLSAENVSEVSIPQNFLLVSDSLATDSALLAENLRRTMKYAGLAFQEATSKELPAYTSERMGSFSALIFAAENAARKVYGPDLIKYLTEGGILCVAMRTWCDGWPVELGLRSTVKGEFPGFIDGAGLDSTEPVYQNFQVSLPEKAFVSNGLDLDLSDAWKVHLKYINPERPLLISRKFGKGRVIFWNASCVHQKEFRGIFLFSLLRALPAGLMSIFNTFLFQIDDSPPPAWGVATGPVGNLMGISDYQFYERIWYEQMMPLFDQFNVKLSHFLCFNYRGKVDPPFLPIIDRDPFFSEILEKIIARKDEIALHGLNHQSLAVDETPSTPWPGKSSMIESLQVAQILWAKSGLAPSVAYVPVNNVIDKVGKEALLKGFPTIRGVFRLYLKGDDTGNDPFSGLNEGDEFGPDFQVEELFNIPRLTSGYSLTKTNEFSMLNGVMAHGIINHFIHPDDIYSSDRTMESWEKMYSEFRRMLMILDKALPGAQKIFSSKALVPFKKYLECTPKYGFSGKTSIKAEIPALGRPYSYLFVGDDFASATLALEGCEIVSEPEPKRIYLIKWNQEKSNITFR